MPLFHSNAVYAGWGVAFVAGAAMAPATFSASRFLSDVRRYGVTYMNYVGKPLAYILATAEQPDDHDNPLRVAFGNEAADRDIDEFSRRFGCVVMGRVRLDRERGHRHPRGLPGRLDRQGLPGRGHLPPRTVQECEVARFDDAGALLNADAAMGELVNTTGSGLFRGYYNDPPPPTSGCGTACTGRATWPTATPTAGSTSRAVAPTGCASTART